MPEIKETKFNRVCGWELHLACMLTRRQPVDTAPFYCMSATLVARAVTVYTEFHPEDSGGQRVSPF